MVGLDVTFVKATPCFCCFVLHDYHMSNTHLPQTTVCKTEALAKDECITICNVCSWGLLSCSASAPTCPIALCEFPWGAAVKPFRCTRLHPDAGGWLLISRAHRVSNVPGDPAKRRSIYIGSFFDLYLRRHDWCFWKCWNDGARTGGRTVQYHPLWRGQLSENVVFSLFCPCW